MTWDAMRAPGGHSQLPVSTCGGQHRELALLAGSPRMPGPHCSHEVSGIPLNNLEVCGKISYGSSMKRIPAWPHTKHIFLPDFHSETFSKNPYLPPHWWGGGGTVATGYLTFSANRVGAAILQRPSTVEVRGFIVLSWSPAKCFISQTFALNPFL